MPITALYAALLVALFLLLSVRVIGLRRGARVEIGDGGNTELLRRMRVHANFAEYVPVALILVGLAESLGAPALLLHGLGLSLLAGRAAHAYALSQTPHVLNLRVLGMGLTLTVLALGAVTCLVLSLACLA